MVEIKRITTPVKIYGPNYITKRCDFAGTVQNMPALYDNAADTKAVFYNENTAGPVVWRVDFKDKYAQTTSRDFDALIIEGCSAARLKLERFTTGGQTLPAGEFALEENNLITLPQSLNAQALIFNFYSDKNYFEIGEIRALKFLFDLKATSELTLTSNADGGEYTAQDGSFYAWTSYHRPGAELKISNGNYAQYKAFQQMIAANESVTLLPMKELDFWVVEGLIARDLEADVNRFSGLLDYKLEVLSK